LIYSLLLSIFEFKRAKPWFRNKKDNKFAVPAYSSEARSLAVSYLIKLKIHHTFEFQFSILSKKDD